MRLLITLTFLFCCSLGAKSQDTLQTQSGLRYAVLKEGSGKEAYANRKVKVTYIGQFADGTVFDQNSDGFEFILGRGNVIKGWDEGVRMMKEGDVFLFIIPPKLAYGKKGIEGIIPPDATLIFKVRLLEVNEI